MTDFAFVFPGQGSQAVGMLDAWGDHAGRAPARSTRPPTRSAKTSAALIHEGPKEQLDLTTQHPAGDADRRRGLLPRLAGRWRACARVVAGHSLGEYTHWSPPGR